MGRCDEFSLKFIGCCFHNKCELVWTSTWVLPFPFPYDHDGICGGLCVFAFLSWNRVYIQNVWNYQVRTVLPGFFGQIMGGKPPKCANFFLLLTSQEPQNHEKWVKVGENRSKKFPQKISKNRQKFLKMPCVQKRQEHASASEGIFGLQELSQNRQAWQHWMRRFSKWKDCYFGQAIFCYDQI